MSNISSNCNDERKMTRPSTSLKSRPLFGGAITMDLPSDYLDASDLRQIPDNQEVFLSASSDTSVVLEILALVEEGRCGTDLHEAVKFHFESIAHDNSALKSTIDTPAPNHPSPSGPMTSSVDPSSLPTPEPIILSGTQIVHKFSHNPTGAPRPGHEADEPDTVWIGVALWRCWMDKKKADVVLSVNVNLTAEGGQQEKKSVEDWWLRSVGSLKIADWNLFGDT